MAWIQQSSRDDGLMALDTGRGFSRAKKDWPILFEDGDDQIWHAKWCLDSWNKPGSKTLLLFQWDCQDEPTWEPYEGHNEDSCLAADFFHYISGKVDELLSIETPDEPVTLTNKDTRHQQWIHTVVPIYIYQAARPHIQLLIIIIITAVFTRHTQRRQTPSQPLIKRIRHLSRRDDAANLACRIALLCVEVLDAASRLGWRQRSAWRCADRGTAQLQERYLEQVVQVFVEALLGFDGLGVVVI
ncbi:hypothetical protein BC567DRAFT_212991 [Phyllosticta citribraziliensis]